MKIIALYNFLNPNQDWANIISAITTELDEAGVEPSYLPIADQEINCYVSYRNDRTPNVTPTAKDAYLSEIEAVEVNFRHPEQAIFNPAGDLDPFGGFDIPHPVRMRPVIVNSKFLPYNSDGQFIAVP